MLLAVDVGNSSSTFGLWDGKAWAGRWSRRTDPEATSDEIGVWLSVLLQAHRPTEMAVVCVVPGAERALTGLGLPVWFLRDGPSVGLPIEYGSPLGADRVANAVGGLALLEPPFCVVDLGTATNFDVVDSRGVFVGGALMPGLGLFASALGERTSLPRHVPLAAPARALADSTIEALRSGVIFGYAGAVDAVAARIASEMPEVRFVATGGYAAPLGGSSRVCNRIEPTLTLDGLRIAHERRERCSPSPAAAPTRA